MTNLFDEIVAYFLKHVCRMSFVSSLLLHYAWGSNVSVY